MSHLSSPVLSDAVAALKDAVNSVVDDNHTNHLLGLAAGLSQSNQRFEKRPESTRPVVDVDDAPGFDTDERDMDRISPDRSVQGAVAVVSDSDANSVDSDSVAEVAEVAGVVGVGFYQDEADDAESSGIDLDRSFSTPGIIADFEDLKEGLLTLEQKSAKRLVGRNDDLVLFTKFVELVGRLQAEMGDRDDKAKSLIAASTHKAQELARRLHEQTGVNQGLTTELHAVRTAVQVQTTRANEAEAHVGQLQARNTQLEATVGGFVTGVTGLLTLIQSDLEARLRKINPIYDVNSPGQMLYRIEGLRQDGNTKLASYVEELIRKHQALSSAKAAMEQNPSVQSLNTAFNTLLNSAAVRKSHTGFRAVFGLESATHQKIAKQASAFRTLYPNANVAQPAAHADR